MQASPSISSIGNDSVNISKNDITAVILAGGRGSRVGGRDKGLIPLNGKPLIQYVVDMLQPQAHDLLITINRHSEEYARLGHATIKDELSDFQGPLAGLQQALQAAKTSWVVTAPCDTPFIPTDLVTRLSHSLKQSDALLAIAHDGKREQPLLGIFSTSLLQSLQTFLAQGQRKTIAWQESMGVIKVDFSDEAECFINLNTPEEIQVVEQKLKGGTHVE